MSDRILNRLFLFIAALFLPFYASGQIGNIIWEDNFDSFDNSVWTADVGDGCNIGLCGWGNQELQSYETNNVYVQSIPGEPGNTALVLEAKNETSGNSAFTSGKVVSDGKLSVQYGLIEIRMQVPDLNTGLWPAAWMLGTSNLPWPAKGEIDIMEMGHSQGQRAFLGHSGVNSNNFVGGNAIFANADGSVGSIAFDPGFNQPYVSNTSMANRFVTYRFYWEPTKMRYTVTDNGTEYDLYTAPLPIGPNGVTKPFTKPFFLLLNLAVGGNFTDAASNGQVSAPLPAKMLIDYVKVFEWNGFGNVQTNYNTPVVNNGTFGVFTETTPIQNELDFSCDAQIFSWGGTVVEGTELPYEGTELISWKTVAANTWFGGGILASPGKDMSNYVATGSLKFKIKIPADLAFRIGITDNNGNESWLSFAAFESKYGLLRNGEWAEVEIPIIDFAGSIAFQNLAYMFAISSEPTDFPSYTFEFAIDDIVWTEGPDCPTNLVLANAAAADKSSSAEVEIQSTQLITNTLNVDYRAGTCILLKEGFQVFPGAVFSAIIEDCN